MSERGFSEVVAMFLQSRICKLRYGGGEGSPSILLGSEWMLVRVLKAGLNISLPEPVVFSNCLLGKQKAHSVLNVKME